MAEDQQTISIAQEAPKDEVQTSSKPKPSQAPVKSEFVRNRDEVAEAMRLARGDPIKPSVETHEQAKSEQTTEAPVDKGDQEPLPKRKKKRGRNKSRPRPLRETIRLCPYITRGQECPFGDKCRSEHDVDKYLAAKLPDFEGECPLWKRQGGKCRYGVTCRYSKSHVPLTEKELASKQHNDIMEETQTNKLSNDLRNILRKGTYKTPLADQYIKDFNANQQRPLYSTLAEAQRAKATAVDLDGDMVLEGAVADRERKQIDWSDKLYLAPLTTVGNLPFRRLCKQFGADITCGEMAMGLNLLQGSSAEWALLRRDTSEDIFGVQLCGNNTRVMSKVAELLSKETDIDFIDLNCGCPIDLVYKQGAGSALLARKNRLHSIIRGMVTTADIPITIKVRTGVASNKPVMHQLSSELESWGVSALTIHGRSREQRYTRYADWDYISQCAETVPNLPVYGNGDILSWEDAKQHREQTGVSGLMIARGALMKPWIFKEIKEEKYWDISSSERFDMFKEFCNTGLYHWGSDLQGVEKTRRFLLELMSFTCRYIPVGLLERLPPRMNDRPPWFVGRNDMETWLSSNMAEDWVRLSEMLLGPAPPGFTFLPKHKANSYS
eukprot:TRINITY_DN9070_c0_g2_i1.p1 TRINITY_DN9070_c0_g2~~TRINITY_DN9070_c0_g2_i1.p1  ORF type:complete len:609 (+),score=124.53 TRINITY_DN9070_c0_g2_i1:2-1828(+)